MTQHLILNSNEYLLPSIQSSPSIKSSNHHEINSIPSSSYSRTTTLSLDDSIEFISDLEDQNHSNHEIHSPESDGQRHIENQSHQNTSIDPLNALTCHLVMPRLPIFPNTPSTHSIPSTNHVSPSQQLKPLPSSGLLDPSQNLLQVEYSSGHSKKLSSSSSHHNHQSTSTLKILVVGDAHSAHGFGSLDPHPSSLSPFPNHLVRASQIVPKFKLSDPSTYNSLIQHIESPFIRLKQILNPRCFHHQHHSHLPTPTRDDLINVVNAWIESEGYLLLLVEINSFPLSPEELECILTLSRLIPTIPFIPSQIPLKNAIDGQAIVTRQLISKKIRHFSIPKPDHYQPFMFPNREECLVRGSKCYLDWLNVEFAHSNVGFDHYAREQDFITRIGSESESDPFELDLWSEKVSTQMARRNPRTQQHSKRRQWHWQDLSGTNGKIIEQIVQMQRDNKHDEGFMIKQRHSPAWKSVDSFGLPSLTVLMKIGFIEIRKEIGKILQKFYRRILLDSNDNSHHCKCKETNYSSTHAKEPSQRLNFDLVQSDESHHCFTSLPLSENIPNSPSPGRTTIWFIIGLVTAATTATMSICYRNEFLFV